MTFTITIDCSNDAFSDNEVNAEVLSILAQLNDDNMPICGDSVLLRDSNGNTVGQAKFVD